MKNKGIGQNTNTSCSSSNTQHANRVPHANRSNEQPSTSESENDSSNFKKPPRAQADEQFGKLIKMIEICAAFYGRVDSYLL